MMKRSRKISLMLLGGASLITLTACDEAPDPLKEAKLFINQQQCEQQFSATECSTALRDSRTAHVAGAPRFANKEQCEAEFGAGNCEQVQTSSSSSSTHSPSSSSSRTTSSSSSASTPMSDSAMNTARGGGGADGGGGQSSMTSMFIPAMVGYMLGRQMGGAGFTSAPVYRDTQNTAYAGNRPVGRLDGATMPPPSKVADRMSDVLAGPSAGCSSVNWRKFCT